MTSCRIVGVGQRLGGDDGAGPAVIDFLRAGPLPPGVTVTEVGEPSALLPLLEDGASPIVIVDAVLAEPAGEVIDLAPAALETRGLVSVSSHGLSVGQVLALAQTTRSDAAAPPPVRIVAITIAQAKRGAIVLSSQVAGAVPRAAERALAAAVALAKRSEV
jgi:hydrogenase maturation protease